MKKKTRKAVLLLGALVLIVLAFLIFNTLQFMGVFSEIEPLQPSQCEVIDGIVGGEDLQWRASGESFFVSARDRRIPDAEGFLYLVTPKEVGSNEHRVKVVNPPLSFPFRPHGISLRVDEERETLYVLNLAGEDRPYHSIEIFDVQPSGELLHAESIADEELRSPNSLVAIGARSFFVTNDRGSRSSLGRLLESLLRLPLGNVLFYDGSTFHVVHRRTRYANGINASADGEEIYLAETLAHQVIIFRHLGEGALERKEVIKVNSGVDNIDVAPDGSLWIAGHPHLGAYMRHARDPDSPSPSQVLRLARDEAGKWQQEELFVDKGELLSGSATAAYSQNRFAIGAVFDSHILLCEP